MTLISSQESADSENLTGVRTAIVGKAAACASLGRVGLSTLCARIGTARSLRVPRKEAAVGAVAHLQLAGLLRGTVSGRRDSLAADARTTIPDPQGRTSEGGHGAFSILGTAES